MFAQVRHGAAGTAYLRDLDDNLKGAKFDIVNVNKMYGRLNFGMRFQRLYRPGA